MKEKIIFLGAAFIPSRSKSAGARKEDQINLIGGKDKTLKKDGRKEAVNKTTVYIGGKGTPSPSADSPTLTIVNSLAQLQLPPTPASSGTALLCPGDLWLKHGNMRPIFEAWSRQGFGVDDLIIHMHGMEQAREKDKSLPQQALNPLLMCFQLRMLTVVRMERVYQLPIWQAVWQNPSLEYLELGIEDPGAEPPMPCELPSDLDVPQAVRMKSQNQVKCAGSRAAHRRGVTKFVRLDSTSIEEARTAAGFDRWAQTRFSVQVLVLRGFVVDNEAILRWFDPKQLKQIILLENCKDCGLDLRGSPFAHIEVEWRPHSSSPASGAGRRTPLLPSTCHTHEPSTPKGGGNAFRKGPPITPEHQVMNDAFLP